MGESISLWDLPSSMHRSRVPASLARSRFVKIPFTSRASKGSLSLQFSLSQRVQYLCNEIDTGVLYFSGYDANIKQPLRKTARWENIFRRFRRQFRIVLPWIRWYSRRQNKLTLLLWLTLAIWISFYENEDWISFFEKKSKNESIAFGFCGVSLLTLGHPKINHQPSTALLSLINVQQLTSL